MSKKIVITGGLGYIGTELCKIYSGESWKNQVTVIDNRFISERVNQLRNWNINYVNADIRDSKNIKILKADYKLGKRVAEEFLNGLEDCDQKK